MPTQTLGASQRPNKTGGDFAAGWIVEAAVLRSPKPTFARILRHKHAARVGARSNHAGRAAILQLDRSAWQSELLSSRQTQAKMQPQPPACAVTLRPEAGSSWLRCSPEIVGETTLLRHAR